MQRLVEAFSAHALLERGSPDEETALATLRDVVVEAWTYVPAVNLVVRDDGLEYQGMVHPAAGAGGFSELLHDNGVRTLRIASGVEAEELERLFKALQRARVLIEDDIDDLVTILWNEDFEFIGYETDDSTYEPSGITKADTENPEAAAVREHVNQDVKAPRPEGIVDLEAFDSTLYFLEKAEIEALRAEIHREYEHDLAANVLSMLLDIFELQEDAKTRLEVVGTLEELMLHLLAAGDFRSVSYLIGEAKVAAKRAKRLGATERKAMADLTARLSRPEALGQLFQAVDDAPTEAAVEADLIGLFEELRPEALPTMLKWMGRAQSDRTRSLIRTALEGMAQSNPAHVARALGSEERAVIMGALDLVARLRLTEAETSVASLAGHSDIGVRGAVVSALAGLATPASMRGILAMLEDRDPDVRIAAIQSVGHRRYGSALPILQKMVLAKDLADKDLSEKRAIFEAYGVLGGASSVGPLASLLVGKGLKRRHPDSDIRACAAMALGKVGSREAREVLTRAASDKDPLVRTAVSGALGGA